MKKIFLLIAICFLTSATVKKHADCGCNNLGEAKHKRQVVKNRSAGSLSGAEEIPITDILDMVITSAEKKAIKDEPDKTVEREKRMVAVTGYAWIIKLDDEDCDIHMEISATNSSTAKRIIAEIPNTSDYCSLHNRVLNELVSKFGLTKKDKYRFDKGDNDGKPIKVTVRGFLFWDSGHPTNSNHGTAKVGSVWEVHPVYSLKWE